MLLLLASLLIPLQQERDVDKLFERLSHDSIEERQKAEDALVDMGEKVFKLIEKRLAGLKGEVKARCERVLERIAAGRYKRSVLPPFKQVQIDVRDADLSEVLKQLCEKSGLPLRFIDVPVMKVTLKTGPVAPLEALDSICKTNGLIVQFREDGSSRFIAHLWKFPFVDAPRTYVRHYRMAIHSIRLVKSDNFRRKTTKGSLEFSLRCSPGVRPNSIAAFRVISMRDDHDRELYDQDLGGTPLWFRDIRYPSIKSTGNDPVDDRLCEVDFKYPQSDAKLISSIKGLVILAFPEKKRTLIYPAPSKARWVHRKLKGLTISLRRITALKERLRVELQVEGKWDRRNHRFESKRWPYRTVPFGSEDVKLRTEDGKLLTHKSSGESRDGNRISIYLYFKIPDAKIKTLEIKCTPDFFFDEFEFELKDVPIPK